MLNKVDLTPAAAQVIQASADVAGLVVKASSLQNLANVFEMRFSNNAVGAYIDNLGDVSAQAFKVAGTALASTHLSDSAALARLASPTFTGTPAAPTPTAGDNTTKLATTAFVQSALSSLSTVAGTSGTLASRPAASANTGKFYYATDQAVLYFSDGTNWNRQGVPAGTVVDWMQPSAVVPTGWVAYDGSVLAGSTGIYADLYAHLGNTTTLPDTRGRMTVAKGSHADVLSIGNNDGAAVASRRPKHKHSAGNPTISVTQPTISISDPGHGHTITDNGHSHAEVLTTATSGSGGIDVQTTGGSGSKSSTDSATTGIIINSHATGIGATASGASATASGMTVGPQTGSEPTDSSAYIVTLKIAKL